jgi:uncharacterized protein YndB with AHSA1/START domain
MSVTTRIVQMPPEKAWSVLADGWLYPLWVVGATRMRDVDEDWPSAGSCLHHSAGVWPLTIDDTTEVLEVAEGKRLVLRARAWPFGEAHVAIELHSEDGGEATEIVLEETAVSGPGALVPDAAERLLLGWRNVEALRRLAMIIEGR